ncbi:hypothetical protein PoMZ_09182 [Pyricularia oryzae]|uniref:Uncharacterized protein n=1 Tax=Pyricularia oryzae TaxID=318829 RepID=A0A4P7MTG6_PYROR|nr:hypothetical protein PoMZ_09182 [Pyricularia oryzae]
MGINIKDRFQITTQVFPLLRYFKTTVDYFFRNIVFPRFIKDFPNKLTVFRWNFDVVKSHPIIGFSGTKNSREFLLLSDKIEIILLLSREEIKIAANDAEQVLTAVINAYPDVYIILDVGAQILEFNNFQMAKQWLEINN